MLMLWVGYRNGFQSPGCIQVVLVQSLGQSAILIN